MQIWYRVFAKFLLVHIFYYSKFIFSQKKVFEVHYENRKRDYPSFFLGTRPWRHWEMRIRSPQRREPRIFTANPIGIPIYMSSTIKRNTETILRFVMSRDSAFFAE